MRRRDVLQAIAPLLALVPNAAQAEAASTMDKGSNVLWKPIKPAPKDLPAFEGFTDCVPDIVGRLGSPVDLAIFTEGNHFPALLGGEILGPFRTWAARDSRYGKLQLDNIVVVTLPQPIIVSMIKDGGIVLGNLTLSVGRESGFYPDVVMGGQAPLKALRESRIIDASARVFARSRGPALLVRAGNPLGISGIPDLIRPEMRIVLATAKEPGARAQYFSALDALLGKEQVELARRREVVDFPGRLGIQHRDILQALSIGAADAGIIVRHLAQYFAATYPDNCQMIPIEGADQFASTIALATVQQPLRSTAAQAFTEYFLGAARTVYPHYGFAEMSSSEYEATLVLD
jgi:ABC-type molybdate transport system substrate-binding protein